jgi:type 1 glutamine amidotransferase
MQRLAVCFALSCLLVSAESLRVRVVTGGHDHPLSFYSVFEGQHDWQVVVDGHPSAFRGDLRRNTDVLVLYDMVQELPQRQKENLKTFAESGRGIVALHHSIVSYNHWDWYLELIGGRYLQGPQAGMQASTYKHDVDLVVKPVAKHPVLAGIGEMRIVDETYKGMRILPDIKVLLEIEHPHGDRPVAWISPYTMSRVVYIQLGHGSEAHRHEGYRRLVRNAVQWAGRREE